MRRLIVGFLMGAILATVGTLHAATTGSSPGKAYTMLPGQSVTFGGLTCTAYKGTTAVNANVVCVRTNLVGYGVVVSQAEVVVAKKKAGKISVVFKANNR